MTDRLADGVDQTYPIADSMSDDRREAAFQTLLESQVPYFAAAEANGNLAWFQSGNPKRAETITELGLPADVSDLDLRRALFFRRHQ